MAASDHTQGYQCEFIDSVPEDFYCKKCTLVARQIIFTSCCEETYCHACITDIQEQGKPCPACEREAFTTVKLMKYQKKVNHLKVYCSMKERGCDWSGTLEQLDTHLDPDQDNCQYVDTKCPLNCHMTIPKNKVEQHVAQHCAKRPYVCQHCNFKATYEEVVDKHLLECKYVPLQCPNLCGVTFERDFMEDHMNMCRLEEIGCEFSAVGCDDRFIREDQEEHTRQNSQKHLTLAASVAVEIKEQLQQKLLEQDKKHKEEEEKLKQKIDELEKRLDEQAKMLNVHLNEEEKRFEDQDKCHKEEKQMLKQKIEKQLKRLKDVEQYIMINRTFKMENSSKQREDWFSPAMYTHIHGYKFCIGVDRSHYGLSIDVDLWSMSGEYDDQLKWPARANFTIKLINQQGGENATCTAEVNMKKPTEPYIYLANFQRISYNGERVFLARHLLDKFLDNDTLHFCVSKIDFL